jgi:Ran GTPase-activating protein (RanGAP) involved in mRNA processing and transport
MFKSNQTLISIGLQNNQITDQSIQYFEQIITFYNKTIQEISLYSNKLITDSSIPFIINIINKSNSLNAFWLWDCQLSQNGINQIQQSIQNKINFDLRLENFSFQK